MVYKHRIVQGLADLIDTYAGKGDNPMMAAIWYGIKGQVPAILQALDSNEEAIAEIEKQLRKALGIEPEPEPEVVDLTVTEESQAVVEEKEIQEE